jgi:PAS domain S-box-containing protein
MLFVMPDGTITDANATALTILGTTRDALVGRDGALHTFEMTREDGSILPVADYPSRRAARTGLAAQQIMGVAVPHRGEAVWLNVHAVPDVDRAGEVSEIFLLFEDVTAEKRLEAQLRQSQKLEAIGTLAGGIAHDFNNLLTVIMGYGELLAQDIVGNREAEMSLAEMSTAARSAAELTRQLLAFGRKQLLVPSVVDLREIVTRMERMLRRLIAENIEIRIVQTSDPTRVKVDRGQIEQILLNLAVNARDAMPQGGKLTIEVNKIAVAAPHGPDLEILPGPYALMTVTDTGSGMTKSVQRRIFEPFFTTKDPGVGTGLGLSTVHGVVHQSGGYLSVYSEPGLGSTFKIYLPTVDEAADALDAEAAAGTAQGTETILIAEDEPALRAFVRRILTARGYTVLDAANATEARLLSERFGARIHVLVTDVVMPGDSGRVLAEDLVKGRPSTKILFMSGYAGSAIADLGVLESHAHFLHKPFTAAQLLTEIRRTLDTPR